MSRACDPQAGTPPPLLTLPTRLRWLGYGGTLPPPGTGSPPAPARATTGSPMSRDCDTQAIRLRNPLASAARLREAGADASGAPPLERSEAHAGTGGGGRRVTAHVAHS